LWLFDRSLARVALARDGVQPAPTKLDRFIVRAYRRAFTWLFTISRPGPCECRYILGFRTALIHDCEEHYPIEDAP
jgi:hypothetical protein